MTGPGSHRRPSSRERIALFFLAQPGRVLLWLGATALAFGMFVDITKDMLEGDVDAVDRAILLAVVKTRTAWLTTAALDLTALGSFTLVLLFSAVTLVVLLALRDRMGALQLLVASAGAGMLAYVTKNTIERARPSEIPRLIEVSGFSYPSGHSLLTSALYLTIAIIAGRYVRDWGAKAAILLAVLAVLILVGASRIYLGVHYPTDVASGISLGAAWALLLAGCFMVFERSRSR